MPDPIALISIPTYDGNVRMETCQSILAASKDPRRFRFQFAQQSLLPRCFNTLWAMALNARKDGVTHFAMLHADIVPEVFWLDKLTGIAEEHKADILSVVIPIKSPLGLTSTALDTDKWNPSRLTMKQVHSGPATFTHPKLLVNTGLMLVDITKEWAEKIAFRFDDAVERDEKGNWQPQSVPEDWKFSRDARELGASIFATREVTAIHHGHAMFTNALPWGQLEVDDFNGAAVLV